MEHEIAENFFQGSSLGAWLGYAVTFVARPLGGIILGIIADHYGRKLSVNLSLGGMIVATVAQGCLPGKYFGGKFQGLGFGLLMIFRALQGLSAGGEIGAVTAYLMEVSPVQTLGMAVCMISIGSQTAWAFASAMLAVLNQALGSEAMLVWGWRIPFLFSALPGALAMWGRNRIQETDVFLSEVRNDEGHKQQHVCKSIMELLIHYPVVLLIGILGGYVSNKRSIIKPTAFGNSSAKLSSSCGVPIFPFASSIQVFVAPPRCGLHLRFGPSMRCWGIWLFRTLYGLAFAVNWLVWP